jgi:hypothetical protein
VTLGCRAHRIVVAAARAVTARVLLVVMVPWAGTTGAVSSPLVHFCAGIGAVDVQEPGVEEPSGRSPAWSSRPNSSEVSLDHVQDGGKNRICMWSHL